MGIKGLLAYLKKKNILKMRHLRDYKGKKIAIWGLAFKPKTDDMREAPSISIIKELQSHGAEIHAFDPEAQHTAKNHLKDITYYNCPYETIKDAHALVIATEWNEFRNLDKEKLKQFPYQLLMNVYMKNCLHFFWQL